MHIIDDRGYLFPDVPVSFFRIELSFQQNHSKQKEPLQYSVEVYHHYRVDGVQILNYLKGIQGL